MSHLDQTASKKLSTSTLFQGQQGKEGAVNILEDYYPAGFRLNYFVLVTCRFRTFSFSFWFSIVFFITSSLSDVVSSQISWICFNNFGFSLQVSVSCVAFNILNSTHFICSARSEEIVILASKLKSKGSWRQHVWLITSSISRWCSSIRRKEQSSQRRTKKKPPQKHRKKSPWLCWERLVWRMYKGKQFCKRG